MIVIENLSFSYDSDNEPLEVLCDLSLSIEKGEFISFVGPSGCGKTTLLKLISGLIEDYNGNISVDSKLPTQARIDKSFGIIFQKASLLNWRTVFQNIALPMEISKAVDEDKVYKLIDFVGLSGFEDSYPHQLSGGMQSRVAIARALSMEPKFLLMDEPFGNLDELTRLKMNIELTALKERIESTVVLITHSINEAVFLSDKIYVLSERPAKILENIEIKLERPRTIEIQNQTSFLNYTSKIKELMGINTFSKS